MRKIILLAGLVAGGVALSVPAYATNWLLYLPAIIAGKGGNTGPSPSESKRNILLYLPAILAGSQKGTTKPVAVTGKLNDTGILTTVGNTGAEDADYGRDADVATNNDADGHAGFSFVKLDNNGKELSASATSWSCVQDKVTGLVWEVKTAANAETTYDWAGATAYADNFAGCGDTYTICRMPTIKELLSIVSWGSAGNIDKAYFPNTASATYLTGTEVANDSSVDSADIWGFDFSLGVTDSLVHKISDGYRVRAVCTAPAP